MASFKLSEQALNAGGCWGPGTNEPVFLADLPYTPFRKDTFVAKSCNWTRRKPRWKSDRKVFGADRQTRTDFAEADVDEDKFVVIDNQPKQRYQVSRRIQGNRGWKKRYRDRNAHQNRNKIKGVARWGEDTKAKRNKRRRWAGRRWTKWRQQRGNERASTVDVKDSWELVCETDTTELAKARFGKKVAAKDKLQCGSVQPYNKAFDKVRVRSKRKLQRFEDITHVTETTSNDPVIQRFKKEKAGTVYATATIMALLMNAQRSVLPWDVVATKEEDGTLFFDLRPKSLVNFVTVDEKGTPADVDNDDINHQNKLRVEATFINHNYAEQVLLKKGPKAARWSFEEPNPFEKGLEEGAIPASVGYRYRSWALNNKDTLIARTEVNGFDVRQKRKEFISIFALNEYDNSKSKTQSWRAKLDTMRAMVLTQTLRNNSPKVTRWVAEAFLAGCNSIRVGFVTRAAPANSFAHEIIGAQTYGVVELAKIMGMRTDNMWGSLQFFIDKIREQKPGKYVIMKDPNKENIYIYSVPANAFASEEVDSEDEEDQPEERS